jgi:hypothetical protein
VKPKRKRATPKAKTTPKKTKQETDDEEENPSKRAKDDTVEEVNGEKIEV